MSRAIWLSPRKDRAGIIYLYHKEGSKLIEKLSTGTRDPVTAEEYEARYKLGLKSEAKGEDVTVLDCVLRYYDEHGANLSSAGGIRTVMKNMLEPKAREYAELPVKAFDRAAQKALCKALTGEVNTRKRKFEGVVATAIRWMQEEEYLKDIPKLMSIDGVKGKGLPFGDVEYIRAYLNACETIRERRFVLLMATTCPRPKQILELTWDRVLQEAKCVDYNVPGKEHTYRKKLRAIAPVADTAFRYLLDTRHEDERLLINGTRRRGGKRAISQTPMTGYKKWLKAVAARARLPGNQEIGIPYQPYRIRKGLATWMRNKGVPAWDVKAMLGHSIGGVTEDYAQYDPTYMLAARNAVEALLQTLDVEWLRPYAQVQQKNAPSSPRQAEGLAIGPAQTVMGTQGPEAQAGLV